MEIGNNGNKAVEVLHFNGLIKDGMTAENIAEAAKPFMINPKHLDNDDFFEDVFCRAEELGYKLKY